MQGVVFFQGRGNTLWYAERLKKHYNAVDGTFYDAIIIKQYRIRNQLETFFTIPAVDVEDGAD